MTVQWTVGDNEGRGRGLYDDWKVEEFDVVQEVSTLGSRNLQDEGPKWAGEDE